MAGEARREDEPARAVSDDVAAILLGETGDSALPDRDPSSVPVREIAHDELHAPVSAGRRGVDGRTGETGLRIFHPRFPIEIVPGALRRRCSVAAASETKIAADIERLPAAIIHAAGELRPAKYGWRRAIGCRQREDGKRYHGSIPSRASIRYPETRNTQISEMGRKIFHPSRISWS